MVHRLHDVGRRVDALDLHAHDAHAPLVGGVVEDVAQVRVDLGAGREGVVEGQVADQVAQVRLREFRDRELEVGDVVHEPLGVGCLVVHDRVHADDHVVRRDHLLRRHFHDLLAHVDEVHPVDERDDDPQPRVDGPLVPPQPLDDAPLVRAHDLDAAEREHEQEEGQDGQDDDCCHRTAPSRRPSAGR